MTVIFLFLACLAGYVVVTASCPDSPSKERAIIAFPFGLGLTTLIIWIMLSIGMEISTGKVIFVLAGMITGVSLIFRNHFSFSKTSHLINPKFFFNFNLTAVIVFTLVIIALWFNLAFPVMVSDGIGYKVFGRIAISEQSLDVYEKVLSISDQNRTLGFHLFSGVGKLFGFDSKIVQWIFYVSLVMLFHFALKRESNSPNTRWFTLLLASSPMIWWHSFLYLNNLASGFYFFCGILYWYRSVHLKNPQYMFLASLAFMMAAWIRYELIIIYVIPLILSMLHEIEHEKQCSSLYLLSFPLIFSGLWAVYSSYYHFGTGRTLQYIALFSIFAVVGIIFVSVRKLRPSKKRIYFSLFALAISFFLALIFWGSMKEKLVLLTTVFLAKLFNNIMSQSVWGFGILMVLFIPWISFRQDKPKKLLLVNLVGIFLGFTILFSVFTMKHPMLNESIWERIRFFVLHPGEIATRTSSREFFILFPGIMYLFGSIFSQTGKILNPTVSEVPFIPNKKISKVLAFLAGGNLIVILLFFVIPRSKFLVNHIGDSYEQILETYGTSDNPNIYQPTYIISHRIRDETPENSTIIMPHPFGSLAFKKKPYDSIGIFAAFDVLYPRKIFWQKFSKESYSFVIKNPLFRVAYAGDEKECEKASKKSLDYHNWSVCSTNASNLSLFPSP